MSSKRDGAFVVPVDPIFKIVLQIMPHRYDATNYTFIKTDCAGMDAFIEKQFKETGVTFTYMDVVIAATVRTLAKYPKLNRFVMNGRLYENYRITPCFTIKTKMEDDAEEAQLKYAFCGHETIGDIKKVFSEMIATYRKTENATGTTQIASLLAHMPMFLTKAGVRFFVSSDRGNRYTKLINEVSPFHCSFCITNLKSLKIDAIVHHCYDFGTTSLFVSMGKECWEPIVNAQGDIVKALIMPLGISTDERICDGFAFARGIKSLKALIENPEELLQEFHNEKIDKEIEKRKIEVIEDEEIKAKEDAKQAKKDAKAAKKAERLASKSNK